MRGADDQAAWDRPVFITDGRTVTVGHVILAAYDRGELDVVWRRLQRHVECEAASDGVDTAAPEDDQRLQALSDAFRYERDLISAEETERWLEDRGLTLEDFDAYLLRHAQAEGQEDPEASDAHAEVTATDPRWPLLIPELWFSGDLDRMATRLAWTFAAAQAERDGPPADGRRVPEAGAIPPPRRREWPASVDDPAWRATAADLEAAFQRECRRIGDPHRLARSLPAMRVPLTRVDLEAVETDSLDAVREMTLCVREDGLSLEDAAAQAGFPYECATWFIEDLPDGLQQKVVCAAPGDLLDPIALDGGFRLYRVLAKEDPDLAVDDVRGRVHQRLTAQQFTDRSASSVRWVLRSHGEP